MTIKHFGIAAAFALALPAAASATTATYSVFGSLSVAFTAPGATFTYDLSPIAISSDTIGSGVSAYSFSDDPFEADPNAFDAQASSGGVAGAGVGSAAFTADFSLMIYLTNATGSDINGSVTWDLFASAAATASDALLADGAGIVDIGFGAYLQSDPDFLVVDEYVFGLGYALTSVESSSETSNGTQSFTIGSGDTLVLDMYFYVDAIAEVDAAPVPVPPAMLGATTALGGLGLLGAIRRRAQRRA